MARPLRIEYEGAWYHVMNRGRGRQSIFPGPEGYRAFLETVGEACERFGLEVHAYCLMPNHYHLLVRTPAANLGRCMRHIDGLYTQRHNRAVGTDGSLFRGRYKAILVEADAYLLAVSRYIHRNPIDGDRPLVDRLEDWEWSSYPAYVKAAKPVPWLRREATYSMLGRRDRYRGYRRFVGAGVEAELADYYANQRAKPILGDDDFVEAALSQAHDLSEVPQGQWRRFKTPDAVLAAVASVSGVEQAELMSPGRRGPGADDTPRQLAMLVCRDETGLTLREIGQRLGGVHYATVSHHTRRMEQRLRDDRRLAQMHRRVLSRLNELRSYA